MSKELDLLKQIKCVDSNMSREQNQRYSELEQALTELEELKIDVKRYFELWEQAREKWGNGLNDVEAYEATKLHIKLSKVGKEE